MAPDGSRLAGATIKLRIIAFCALSFRESTARAAGVSPLTSPPWVDPERPLRRGERRVEAGMFGGAELVYFALHGFEWSREWWGDAEVALRAETLARANLRGAVAFAESCWLPESDMLAALFEAGCRTAIGGSGLNWGGSGRVAGVGLLGRLFRILFSRGLAPGPALWLAKLGALLAPGAKRDDILDFQVYEVGQ